MQFFARLLVVAVLVDAIDAMSLSAPVDLRSDTVTTPTPSMREAMARAEVGDDVFGDDPTVHKIEQHVAELFGKEAALFVPTGTQGNLISIMAHTWERTSEYIVGDEAHIYIFEQGGGAQFGGAHPRALSTQPDGSIGSVDQICAAIRPADQHFPVTKCVALENTHNLRGGKVLPLDYVKEVGEAVHERGVALHIDGVRVASHRRTAPGAAYCVARLCSHALALAGSSVLSPESSSPHARGVKHVMLHLRAWQARIWHAASCLGVSLADVAAPADSLSVCLSKALGAPAGSLVVGSAELIAKSRRLRKGLGGTMRQTGVLAAAGLIALEEILPNLANDHANTARLAAGLAALGFDVEPPQTNLLYFSLTPGESHSFTAKELVAACATEGVRFLVVPGSDPNRMRMVCHHQVTAEGVAHALEVIGKACAQPDWVTAGASPSTAATSYAGGER